VATKKDLVEAHAFSRRRLVTAFVSGAPGGREVEPPRPMRAVIGGAALCVLLLAGAAIAGVFSPRTPDGWLDPQTLVASKEKGNLYLVVDKGGSVTLRPFVNPTSAQLLLGEMDPVRAAQEEIDKQVIGPEMGIIGAPSSIPPTSHLVQSGWTACTSDDHGILTRIASSPGGTEVDNGATVVETPDHQRYLVAYAATDYNDDPQAVSFTLPGQNADVILGQLELGQASDATEVDSRWLSLFKPYTQALDASQFTLGDSGRIDYAAEIGGGSHDVGDLVRYQDEVYLLTEDGPAELTPFALAVYESAVNRTPSKVTRRPGDLVQQADVWPDTWPEQELELIPGDACAMLAPRVGESPTVRLIRDEVDDAQPDDVARSASAARVEPGHGALVTSGSFDSTAGTTPYLIDSKGLAYPVADATALEHLGYASVEAPVIPDSWLELFATGPQLSAEGAGDQPADATGQG